MYRIVVFLVFALFLFSIYYIVLNIGKLNIFENINGKYKKIIISLVPIILVFFSFNVINSIVVLMHLFLIMLLFNTINKLFKNKLSKNLCVILSICFTILYLGYGMYQVYNVRETKYEIETNKNIGSSNFRIVQITDSHMGTTFDSYEFEEYINEINKKDPDIVVVTGDFIDDDTSKKDIEHACEVLGKLNTKYGVYFVFGNHDLGYYKGNNLKELLKKNNIKALEDEIVSVNDNILIVGRKDRRYPRKDIKQLVKDLDSSKYIIDLNHQPNDYENEKNNVDLVLSGHTHGGQLFPLGLFDKLLNIDDEYYGLHTRGNTKFIVSSGISNWALHFKTGTFSEYVIIDLKGNNNE